MHALACTLGVFALILILARMKVPLVLAITAGVFVIGFLFGMRGEQVLYTALAGVIQPRTISLTIVTMLLLCLSMMMRLGGQMDDIVSLAKSVLRRPVVTMAALPALIGLLPMPGGALFSAPMVESAAGSGKLARSVLSAVNYWFRHIWEHWWPLYPGVILAVELVRETMGTAEIAYLPFAACQLPLGVFMVVSGLLLFRRMRPDLRTKSAPPPPGTARKLLWATSSIWVILLVWVPAKYVLALLILPLVPANVRRPVQDGLAYLPLAAGLIVSICWTVKLKGHSWRDVAKTLAAKQIYAMGVLVVSVMAFQYMLGQIGAPARIAGDLKALHVPVVLVVAILPFIAGMVTGLAIGFVGTSFPIVLALVALPDHGSIRPYVALAYGFGHLGQMMSPLHVCHIVSNQYFKTSFGPVYRQVIPSAGLAALLIVAYFVVLRAAI